MMAYVNGHTFLKKVLRSLAKPGGNAYRVTCAHVRSCDMFGVNCLDKTCRRYTCPCKLPLYSFTDDPKSGKEIFHFAWKKFPYVND